MELREAKKWHKRLWGWLVESGSDDKMEWGEWVEAEDAPNECFACLIALQRLTVGTEWTDWTDDICPFCPIDWGEAKECNSPGSVYEKWCHAINLEDRKELAAIIRDIPWKKQWV